VKARVRLPGLSDHFPGEVNPDAIGGPERRKQVPPPASQFDDALARWNKVPVNLLYQAVIMDAETLDMHRLHRHVVPVTNALPLIGVER
jgi:hypothetical protein